NKRERDDFWNGGLVLPKAKRRNIGNDTDIMAMLDMINDNINYTEKNNIDGGVVIINELGIPEEERLNVVIKSLEEEIGFSPNGIQNADGPRKEGEIVGDNINNNSLWWTGFLRRRPLVCITVLSHFHVGDHSMDYIYQDSLHGYADNTE
ncbi:hypothetical protein KI387_009231, partial [Taxus chinensis]